MAEKKDAEARYDELKDSLVELAKSINGTLVISLRSKENNIGCISIEGDSDAAFNIACNIIWRTAEATGEKASSLAHEVLMAILEQESKTADSEEDD